MRAVITGASAGIGREMARILAARGYDLTLIARREERLKELAAELPVRCKILAADVSSVRQCRLVYEAARGDDVEIVINNAGFGLFGQFAETDLDRELEMIQTNIVAVHVLTKLFLRDFKKRNKGYLMNVSSSAAFFAGFSGTQPRIYFECGVLGRVYGGTAHGNVLCDQELCAAADTGNPGRAAAGTQPRAGCRAVPRTGEYRI